MSTCSVENCGNECFEQEDKCILHCEKDEKNGWHTCSENNKKIWDDVKVNLFWNLIQSYLNEIYIKYMFDIDLIEKEYVLSNVVFPKFQDEVEYFSPASNEDEMGTNFYSYKVFEHPQKQPMPEVNTFFTKLIVSFDSCRFLDDASFKKYNFEHPISFNKCTFESDIELNKIYTNRVSFLVCTIQNLNCQDIIFEQKVKIQNCTINGKSNFYNTKFKDLADFYRTKFNEVVFERADFEKVAVFSEVIFNEDVDFKYTKFLGKSIFRDTVIKGKLNLRNTIFDDEANFLDITSEERKKGEKEEFYGEPKVITVSNRETARIIKNFYDKSSNIIEANKFYALEMKERRKELDYKSSFVEWVVFFLHGLSSNHSQSWFEALFWILLLGGLYTFEVHKIPLMTLFITFITIYTMIEYFLKKYTVFIKYFDKAFPILFMISAYYIILKNIDVWFELVSMSLIDKIANNINIFSNFSSADMTFGDYVYKLSLSYLIYQFIVSVRQNTRRK